jgi:hypothetical protein
MTEPSPSRPVPGPPRPGPGPARFANGAAGATRPPHEAARPAADAFPDLEGRPVAEHVDVFEAEHARLERELGTIDRL